MGMLKRSHRLGLHRPIARFRIQKIKKRKTVRRRVPLLDLARFALDPKSPGVHPASQQELHTERLRPEGAIPQQDRLPDVLARCSPEPNGRLGDLVSEKPLEPPTRSLQFVLRPPRRFRQEVGQAPRSDRRLQISPRAKPGSRCGIDRWIPSGSPTRWRLRRRSELPPLLLHRLYGRDISWPVITDLSS